MEVLDDRSVIYQLEVYKKWYEEQQEEIERLNNIIRYIENYFSEREYYEFAQLVRDVKESNIEWLENSLKEKK